MTEEESHERLMSIVYEAAWKNAPPSIGWDILADHLGMFLFDHIGEWPDELFEENANLDGFAEALSEEVLRLAIDHGLAPFDGTLADELVVGDTEQAWLIREDLLPFVRNWHRNVLALEGAKT